ncbi:MAG TPA: YebC/PmpR family DNA-binding transcriptional regulator, partial [Candidatus Limnocylindrales bacterium]
KALDAQQMGVESAENTMIAKSTVELDAHRARQNLRLIEVTRDGGVDPDEVALAAIDAGAEDVDTDDPGSIEIYTAPADLERVRKALDGAGVPVESAENTMVAKQTVELDSAKARQALRLVELLEDLEDVQRVTANFDIPEDVFAEVAG